MILFLLRLPSVSSQEESIRIDILAEDVGITQSLKNSFNPILNVVLLALDAPPVFVRTKALKALGQIVTSDPSILSTVSYIPYPKRNETYPEL